MALDLSGLLGAIPGPVGTAFKAFSLIKKAKSGKLGLEDLAGLGGKDILKAFGVGGGSAGSGMAGAPGGGTTGGGGAAMAADQVTETAPSGSVMAGADWRPYGNVTQGNYPGTFPRLNPNNTAGMAASTSLTGLFQNANYPEGAPMASGTGGGGMVGPGGGNVGKGAPAGTPDKMNPILKSFLDNYMKRFGQKEKAPQYTPPPMPGGRPGRYYGMTQAGY
jgi:hypothetical protein